ncbi:MAG: hypothetical protein E6I61_04760 [Chloroflexi bacterium]|nr:MAG: hypothetical protein E6I71_09785 [Chloroflexota bacterium]TME41800.1 MAG: hypothetical protein E6I61_04760 [Chloroflexota bacterium]TME51236.1 MAG: hypothetical protein E6I53_10985 [Chloroflexota bacterium]
MSVDQLEERLQNLAIEIPDVRRITTRVLARQARRRGRRLPRVALSAVAAILLLALVAYFVPAADTAIADVPFAGDLLREAGLVGASGRITAVDSTSTSSGYKLRLVGAYADSTRTVFLMHADPAIAAPDLPDLADQFGRTYHLSDSISNMLTGDLVMQFEALAWPDGFTGARVTLHATRLELPDGSFVSGDWKLNARLGLDETDPLPLPATATTGSIHYRFTSVAYTPATVSIDMIITGATMDDLNRRIPDGGKGTAVFSIDLIDPGGAVINGTYSLDSDQQGVHLHFLGYRLGPRGDYQLRVTYIGQGSFERVVAIP